MKRKHTFTLIELLTVIAIIGILAGILIPALGAAKNKANKVKARADISALKLAITAFQQEYGVLPGASETYNSYVTELGEGSNPRGIIFLELHPDGTFLDPWGNGYQVRVDHNYDGQVASSGGDISGTSAIWSLGKDGSVNTDDDVTSWE